MRKQIAAIFLLGVGAAKAEEPLPTIYNIPCQKACANSTGLEPIRETRTLGQYPSVMSAQGTEGFVQFDVKVTEQGDAGELSLVAFAGPPEMIRATAQAVKNWKWKPATLEGKPVAVTTLTQMTYRGPAQPGAGPRVISAYQKARDYIGSEQWGEARAVLDEAQASPKLNLYERGMLANIAASVAMKQNDYFEARRASALALNHSADVLPKSVVMGLWRTRIYASLALGDIVGGLEAFDRLKAKRYGDVDEAIAKFVAEARAKADSMQVFGMSARIPRPEDAESLFLGLYRRVFTFRDVKGTLDRFVLSCKQQAIESKITDNAEWRIPASFSECNIRVHGTPGTTFTVVQANP